PKGKPAPFDCFKVMATAAALSAWWQESEAAGPHKGETPGDSTQLIEKLLAGPDTVELTRRDFALLNAYLKQPIDMAPRYSEAEEKRETGQSQARWDRNKLKLIRDLNRELKQQHTPTEELDERGEAAAAGPPAVAGPGRKPQYDSERDREF